MRRPIRHSRGRRNKFSRWHKEATTAIWENRILDLRGLIHPGQVVAIRWVDTVSDDMGDINFYKTDEVKLPELTTYGKVLLVTKERVHLSAEYPDPASLHIGDDKRGACWAIAARSILAVRVLSESLPQENKHYVPLDLED